MKVRIITEIIADVDVSFDDVVNSDTIADYKAELDCDLGNAALHYLSDRLKRCDEVEIISTEPYDEGVDQYGDLLNNWKPEYNRRMKKYER